jgi:hypothetical protein
VGMTNFYLKVAAPFIRGRALSLGYPDVILDRAGAEAIFPDVDYSSAVFNAESRKWHALDFDPLDGEWLLKAAGLQSLDILDKKSWRGKEIDGDLNEALDLGPYDVVFDHGTIEHCMNIGQALKNLAQAVSVGGVIVHGTPMTMLNHGFYNVNPTLFYDFYVRNGFRIEAMAGATRSGWFDLPRTERFEAPPEASIICVVRRVVEAPIRWHMQTKYQNKEQKAA